MRNRGCKNSGCNDQVNCPGSTRLGANSSCSSFPVFAAAGAAAVAFATGATSIAKGIVVRVTYLAVSGSK